MITITAATVGFVLLVGLMALGLHVAFVMFAISMLGAIFYLGWPATLEFGTQYWGATNNFVLVAIPLFVLLGELLVRGGFTDRMYRSLSDWLNPLPGGLLHTNIGASAMFAAVSGSSVATAATIGTVAIPAFKGRNYDPRLVLGSIAAGATLGILIPPSINMIIYGAMTNTSVGRLYAAGVIPGLLLTALFMLVIVVACWWKPSLAGAVEPAAPLRDRLRRLIDLLPPALIFIVVMGSIYLGWATPTESAALGVVMSLALSRPGGSSAIPVSVRATPDRPTVQLVIVALAFAPAGCEKFAHALRNRSPTCYPTKSRNSKNTMSRTLYAEKVSVSLPSVLMQFVEKYRVSAGRKSRSDVFEEALKLLRERELELAYREASAEVDPAWDATVGDGLDHEAW